MADRIRRAVETNPFTWETGWIRVTISLGVAALREGRIESVEALVQAADDFLYQAKNAGRNRVATLLADAPALDSLRGKSRPEPRAGGVDDGSQARRGAGAGRGGRRGR